MEDFTLEEAKRWLGKTVIAKTGFDVGPTKIAAEQQGTVIGITGEDSHLSTPTLCLVVQFWPEQDDTLPRVISMDRHGFNTHLCLSHTVK
jgi:hypothetical protein